MKKYRIEIGLSIILFISVVVLIVNIIVKANNSGKMLPEKRSIHYHLHIAVKMQMSYMME